MDLKRQKERHFPFAALYALSVRVNKHFLAEKHRSFTNWFKINGQLEDSKCFVEGRWLPLSVRRLGSAIKLTEELTTYFQATSFPKCRFLMTIRAEQNFCAETKTRLEQARPGTEFWRPFCSKLPSTRVLKKGERTKRGKKNNSFFYYFNFRPHH